MVRYLRLNLFLLLVFIMASGFSFAQETGGEIERVTWDSFEDSEYWLLAGWGDQADIFRSEEYATEGEESLKIHLTREGRRFQGKGVVLEKKRGALDVSTTKKFILDVYNDAGPMKMAIVLYTDEFCESSPVSLRAGWNKDVTFDLEAENFKSPTSNWQYNYSLVPSSIAWMTMLIFYRGDIEEGDIYVDNIRIDKVPRLKERQIPIALSEYQKPEIVGLTPNKREVKRYEKFELEVDFRGTYQYPYDPEDIDLEAEFISPDGIKYNVPGFLYSADVEGIKIDNAVWKIRFAPDETGKWRYKVMVRNPRGSDLSEFNEFICQPSDSKGMVRISKMDPRYFEFDNGEFYYPIGQNVAWASSAEAFGHYFSRMSENNYNWTRFWMSSWQFALEWLDVGHYHGLGNYSLRNAGYLDEVIELAAENNLYFQLVLNNHGQLSTKVDPEWVNNPYNAENGGPCKTPQDFFTNEEAKRFLKNRLRYIVARWSYSPNVLAWELWNEATLVDDYNAEVDIAWHKEMAAYLKEIDPHRHLVTTSYFLDFPKEIWNLKELDFGQIHMYTPEIVSTLSGLYKLMDFYDKPYFVGEFGTSNLDGIDRMDPKATNQHAGIWCQFMTPSAGNAMPWEWDNYIDPNSLYYHWRALARFAKGEDRRGKGYKYARATITGKDNKSLSVQGVLNRQEAMFWIFDLDRTKFKQKILSQLRVEEAQINIEGMLDGVYLVEFWSTYSGKIFKVVSAEAKNSRLDIALPLIAEDIACKIKLASLDESQDLKLTTSPWVLSSYPEKQVADLKGELWEDFEEVNGWHIADWGDQAELSIGPEKVTNGRRALKATFTAEDRVFSAKGIVLEKNDLNLDLERTKKMSFDIYNDTNQRLEVSVVLNSTGFSESIRKAIDPGANKISFNLEANNFKNGESRWTHTARLDKNKPIRQIMIIIYPWDVLDGTFYIDNLRFSN